METMLETEEEISDYELERGKPMPSFAHAMTTNAAACRIPRFSGTARTISRLARF